MNSSIELTLVQILILIFSVIVHEISHGFAALALGDPTAKNAGRLTLNPIPHIDIFGSILLPAISLFAGGFLFGWAKPVPYNPYNLRNQEWGPAIVGAAGPFSNLVLAFGFGLIVRYVSHLANPSDFLVNFSSIASLIVFLNVLLAVFNLVPIPPLDGSKVLFALLPYRFRVVQGFLEQHGLLLLLFFIFFLFRFIQPIIAYFYTLFAGVAIF